MKKLLSICASLLALVLVLTACSSKTETKKENVTIKVASHTAPMTDMLEMIKDDLKKEGYIMISGTPKGNVFNKITKDNLKLCLIIGSESHGISKEVLNLSDFFVKIQMLGKIESFNAAIAASILMYKVSNEK